MPPTTKSDIDRLLPTPTNGRRNELVAAFSSQFATLASDILAIEQTRTRNELLDYLWLPAVWLSIHLCQDPDRDLSSFATEHSAPLSVFTESVRGAGGPLYNVHRIIHHWGQDFHARLHNKHNIELPLRPSHHLLERLAAVARRAPNINTFAEQFVSFLPVHFATLIKRDHETALFNSGHRVVRTGDIAAFYDDFFVTSKAPTTPPIVRMPTKRGPTSPLLRTRSQKRLAVGKSQTNITPTPSRHRNSDIATPEIGRRDSTADLSLNFTTDSLLRGSQPPSSPNLRIEDSVLIDQNDTTNFDTTNFELPDITLGEIDGTSQSETMNCEMLALLTKLQPGLAEELEKNRTLQTQAVKTTRDAEAARDSAVKAVEALRDSIGTELQFKQGAMVNMANLRLVGAQMERELTEVAALRDLYVSSESDDDDDNVLVPSLGSKQAMLQAAEKQVSLAEGRVNKVQLALERVGAAEKKLAQKWTEVSAAKQAEKSSKAPMLALAQFCSGVGADGTFPGL
ncbi:hypothetical protein P153DRAFT_371563 [Dothidotthia symphoricarpi CBS 119687]|uniref:Uncharacterized protein n=1 Tax=Dothidotthia symphoricarpi CBS 119687 TaxID=1392245 RepID=A0A6A5ZV53_9PLEO|nr:uncharacterized protein P153DRAFT_371563 [Dothidotthia symphoricarpi CBS 119687]KAF2123592.1 hypothetical protein P153DRAFT_371563 [Dothidotthia symphoricarpi CBS 119687]